MSGMQNWLNIQESTNTIQSIRNGGGTGDYLIRKKLKDNLEKLNINSLYKNFYKLGIEENTPNQKFLKSSCKTPHFVIKTTKKVFRQSLGMQLAGPDLEAGSIPSMRNKTRGVVSVNTTQLYDLC